MKRWLALPLAVVMVQEMAMGWKCAPSPGYVGCGIERNEVVFLGRVVRARSGYFDIRNARDWRLATPEKAVEAQLQALEKDNTPDGLKRWKEVYLASMPGLLNKFRDRIAAARSKDEIDLIFDQVSREDFVATFEVIEVFRGAIGNQVEVHSDLSGEGIQPPPGETILVRAFMDNGKIFMHACANQESRPHPDPILYWTLRKRDPRRSSRIEGHVQLAGGKGARYLSIRVESSKSVHFATTDEYGYFGIDGLAAGHYSLSVAEDEDVSLLSPISIDLPAQTCHARELTVTKQGK